MATCIANWTESRMPLVNLSAALKATQQRIFGWKIIHFATTDGPDWNFWDLYAKYVGPHLPGPSTSDREYTIDACLVGKSKEALDKVPYHKLWLQYLAVCVCLCGCGCTVKTEVCLARFFGFHWHTFSKSVPIETKKACCAHFSF